MNCGVYMPFAVSLVVPGVCLGTGELFGCGVLYWVCGGVLTILVKTWFALHDNWDTDVC